MRKALLIIISIFLLSCKQQKEETYLILEKKIEELNLEIIQLTTENDFLITENDSLRDESKLLMARIDDKDEELRLLSRRFSAINHMSTNRFKYLENQIDDIYGEIYRVEIYQSEIYRNIYISRIEYFSEGLQRITSRKEINIFDINNITDEDTSSLIFVEWLDFNKFMINIRERDFVVEIIDPDKFVITENKK